MATKISTYSRLKLLAAFSDEDDRTLTLDNPIGNISESQIHALEPAAAKVLIGDRYGADFTRFKSAAYVNGTTTTMEF